MNYQAHLGPFLSFYDVVTEKLRRQGARAEDRNWFETIIADFQHEFEAWENCPLRRPYCDRLAARRSGVRSLIGLAFLHMGYDLPKVIARRGSTAYEDAVRIGPFFDQDPPAGRAYRSYWETYLDADAQFLDAFVQAAREVPLFACSDRVAKVSRCCTVFDALARAPSLWILTMRHAAWHNAEKLASASASPQVLWQEFERRAEPLWGPVHTAHVAFHLTPPRLPWSQAMLSQAATPRDRVAPD